MEDLRTVAKIVGILGLLGISFYILSKIIVVKPPIGVKIEKVVWS
jgi:hypothetical protein